MFILENTFPPEEVNVSQRHSGKKILKGAREKEDVKEKREKTNKKWEN